MLKIRLQRTGRKHETTFRVVATDSKNSAKSGKILEILGAYDPRRDETTILKADRIKHWISVGAGLSGTVNNLLISKKVIDGKKVNVLPKKTYTKPVVEEAPVAEAPAPAAEAPAPVEAAPEAAPAVEEAPVEAVPAPAEEAPKAEETPAA